MKELNVRWYREQIGMVAQEPVLFMGTVKDNIKYGKAKAAVNHVFFIFFASMTSFVRLL